MGVYDGRIQIRAIILNKVIEIERKKYLRTLTYMIHSVLEFEEAFDH